MFKSNFFSPSSEIAPLFFLLVFIDVILKGITLYKSARRDQKPWFVALLLVNSMGILPIIYLALNKDITFSGSSKPVAKKKVKR